MKTEEKKLTLYDCATLFIETMDDKYPDERIQFILDDSESKTVIVSDETYKRVKNSINIDVNILNISAAYDIGIFKIP